MKKVLIVASTSNHIYTFHMPYIKKLREKYDVKIMARDDNYNLADYDIDFQKKILSFSHFKIIKKIAKILNDEQFDAIVINTSLASFLVRCALKKVKNKPIVINLVHGYFFSHQTKYFQKVFYKYAERHASNQVDYVIVMNDEDRDIAIKNRLFKRQVYKINGMGIDESRFDGKINNIEYKSVENPKFLFIGELSKRKNQMFLIKFISKLKKYGFNASLKLLGEGSYRKKLEKQIKKHHLENQIKIIGYDKNIKKYLLDTDYYICASYIEGLPFNILEAMHCGCVVLSSDIKGSTDLIKDYKNGILYKLDDVDDLIAKFRLLNNSLRLKQMLSENAKLSTEKYLLENVFEDNINLLERLIDGNGE